MAVNSITIGAGTLTIGAAAELINFSGQATSVRLIPSVDTGDAIRVLSGESVAGDYTEEWALEGTLLQDFGSVGSTTEWLVQHSGEIHVFEFIPSTAKGKKISGSLQVTPIEIGGDVNTKPTSDFAWNLIGKPIFAAITEV